MNSIDAAGTKCDITLTKKTLAITDDGKGFADRSEIENFFETFGYPHKEGDATYGRFRMGRGQLFAVGKNRWESNRFVMDVDLKGQGESDDTDFELGYGLTEVAESEAVKGCNIRVDLYEPMNDWMLSHTSRAIGDAVAWAQVPVTLNGKAISRRPQDAEWEIETDDAFVKLDRSGRLSVYNLGVLVCHIPSARFGTGGVVVSKQKLDVNFARNAVQPTCPVWRRIQKHVDKTVTRNITKAKTLDDAGRERLALGIKDGDISLLANLKQRLITDVTGSHRQLSAFSPTSYGRVPLTVAPTGDRVGDKVMQRGMALVLSQDTLDRFKVGTTQELVEALREAAVADLEERGVGERRTDHRDAKDPVQDFLRGLSNFRHASMDGFRKTFTETHEPVDPKALKKGERFAIEAVAASMYGLNRGMTDFCRARNLPVPSYRHVHAGTSDTAAAWTDGTAHVWVNRNQLPLVRSHEGRIRLAGLLLHELIHREPDTQTHAHGVEFYQLYHDMTLDTDILGQGAHAMEMAMERKTKKSDREAGTDDASVLDDLSGEKDVPSLDNLTDEAEARSPVMR